MITPNSKEIVINTTPILSLIAATGSLGILQELYTRVWVPWEVCQEIYKGGSSGHGILEFVQANFLFKQSYPINIQTRLKNSLDMGEASVIQTALNNNIPLVAIDETGLGVDMPKRSLDQYCKNATNCLID